MFGGRRRAPAAFRDPSVDVDGESQDRTRPGALTPRLIRDHRECRSRESSRPHLLTLGNHIPDLNNLIYHLPLSESEKHTVEQEKRGGNTRFAHHEGRDVKRAFVREPENLAKLVISYYTQVYCKGCCMRRKVQTSEDTNKSRKA